MISQQTLDGNWNEIKGKVRSKWGVLTDAELEISKGDVKQLVDSIQRKTGEVRESIEKYFDEVSPENFAAAGRTGENVRAYAHHVADAVQERSQQAAAVVREGYADAEDLVRERPAESLAVCFAAGVITGAIIALLLRSR
jgi:uncharacterized protein YjbJ (UPF0337 family)